MLALLTLRAWAGREGGGGGPVEVAAKMLSRLGLQKVHFERQLATFSPTFKPPSLLYSPHPAY